MRWARLAGVLHMFKVSVLRGGYKRGKIYFEYCKLIKI